MANVTAKQLSEVIGVSVEKLLDQLNTAGVEVSGENDPISDEDKLKLLESLRSSHGKEEPSGPKKITLRRKSKSELRVSGTSGRNTTTKTIPGADATGLSVTGAGSFAHTPGTGFVVMPGGLGTLEEFFEVATWNQLGLHGDKRAIVLLDSGGYLRPLVEMLDATVTAGFVEASWRDLIAYTTDPREAVGQIART